MVDTEWPAADPRVIWHSVLNAKATKPTIGEVELILFAGAKVKLAVTEVEVATEETDLIGQHTRVVPANSCQRCQPDRW